MKLFIIILICVSMYSCSGVSQAEYVRWVENEENGIRKEKTIGDFTFNIQYCPADYLKIKQGNRDKNINSIAQDEELDFSFIFRIVRPADLTDRSVFQLINEFNFSLIQGEDTDRSVLALYENNFNISPIESFTVVFDSKPKNCDFRFVYDGLALGTGPVMFTFKQEDINRIPKPSN